MSEYITILFLIPVVLEVLCLRDVPCPHLFRQHQGYPVAQEVHWLLGCQALQEAQEVQNDPGEKWEKENGEKRRVGRR